MLEKNEKLELAYKIIEKTGCSLFLTGKAGTGKTTFLRELRASSRKRMIVTAPTGIAAINAGGVTLHSFFQLDFGPFVPGAKRNSNSSRRNVAFSKEKIRIIRGLDLLVIDEISMVRSDVLDAVDEVMRRFRDRTLPFGGVQLLLIGDLQQLPPVVVESEKVIMSKNYNSPYFFDSHALRNLDYITLELSKVYRQDDRHFIDLLNAVRDNRIDDNALRQLNSRYIPDFQPEIDREYVRLTTHNRKANELNVSRLAALPGESFIFEAKISGNFPESSYPAEKFLELKRGAQVMFIKNDTGHDRRYFNGLLGTVSEIDDDGVWVTPAGSDAPLHVEPVEWENLKFVVNEDTKEIDEKKDGVFSQLPLKLAWAITIHKSQGLTFDNAIIDASMSFTHGQTYVALSRCRSLEGLVLESPIGRDAIITDRTVSDFLRSQNAIETLNENRIVSMTHAYYLHLIAELFNFQPIFNILEGFSRIIKENFMRLYPALINKFSNETEALRRSMLDVSAKFRNQIIRIDRAEDCVESKSVILQRIKDASNYFISDLKKLRELVKELPTEHDNKTVSQKLSDRLEMFEDALAVKEILLETFCEEDFSIELFLDIKAKGAFRRKLRESKRKSKSSLKSQFSEDNIHPELYDSLCVWRREKASELKLPPYTIAGSKTLLAVSNYLPRTYSDLAMLPGIGKTVLKKYGDDMLTLVDAYIEKVGSENLVILPIPSKRKKR